MVVCRNLVKKTAEEKEHKLCTGASPGSKMATEIRQQTISWNHPREAIGRSAILVRFAAWQIPGRYLRCLGNTPVVPRPAQYTSADRRCRIIPRRFSQSDWPALAHPRQAHPYRCRHPTRRHRRIGGIDSLDPLVSALSLGSPAVPPRFQTLLSGEAVWCAGLACL